MEKPSGPRERKRAAFPEGAADDAQAGRPDDAPIEEPAEKAAARLKEPKVKVTFSLPVSLARLINAVAAELGVDACELVAGLLGPSLRGCRRPTVPRELKAQFGPNRESAA